MKNIPILHTDITGSGPTVVLLHGFLASSHYWKKMTDLVDSDYKVVAFDLLGFGDSPKPKNSSYDYIDHIESINATLKQIGINEPFILMGHSMGSLIALRYATIYDDRVSKLILTNMPVMIGAKQVRDEIMRTNIAYNLGLRRYTHRIMWTVFRLMFTLKFLPRRVVNGFGEHGSYLFKHSGYSRIRSFQKIIRDARVDFDLNAVRVKTLIISGLDDNKVYLDNLFSNIALSPTIALENVQTGHHIPRVMPEVLLERLNDE